MKFAVWILIVLATLSLFSMFAVEFFPIDDNVSDWESVYKEKYGALFYFLNAFHIQDPYRSWWYQALIGALALSLLLCIIDRFPAGVKAAFGNKPSFNRQKINGYRLRAQIDADNSLFEKTASLFKGYSVKKLEKNGSVAYSATRGRWGYLGSPLIHTGLLLLVIGGFLAIWGVSIMGSGFPGDFIESKEFDFKIRVDDFKIEYYPLGVGQWILVDDKKLGKITRKLKEGTFQVTFFKDEKSFIQELEASRIRNKYDISADRGNISDYISVLTVIDEGKEVYTRSIEVNKPLRYKGFRFYQTSFDAFNPKVNAAVDTIVIEITDCSAGAVIDTIAIPMNTESPLPDSSSMTVSRFYPDFKLTSEGAKSVSGAMRNPAIVIEVIKYGEELYHQYCFLYNPFSHIAPEAKYSFKALDAINPTVDTKYMTILEIKKNRGYLVIYVGLILSALGSALLFYLSPKRIRLLAIPANNRYQVTIGAYSMRHSERFEKEFNKIIHEIKSQSTVV
jgi:cytochrome c biogenesis protein